MEPTSVCVVGLGYVGLPLAIELNKHFPVVGFDVNKQRIEELRNNNDSSGEVASGKLVESSISFTWDQTKIRETNFIIICVPTPIDKHKKPDLKYLRASSETIGKNLRSGSIVVYESTVYPGVTEEVCIPVLEEASGMKCGVGFKVGYSPERINPGDTEKTIDKITKIVSGSDIESTHKIDEVYGKITSTHKAPSIRVAEAAKVIENIQRDLNISLMNELAILFDKMDLNVTEVLEAAGTKWNFHSYYPGLVGGHCIGVDPYYLTYKAEEVGHHADVILAGRRINDNMHKFYAHKIIKRLHKSGGNSVLLLGLTFKPNVSDYRNTRVKHLIKELQHYGVKVYAYDPYISKEIVENHFNATHYDPTLTQPSIDLSVLAVSHRKIQHLIQQGTLQNQPILLNNL
jgi:UDP-N-acetyl-D-glucosamine/UDP-N-acetyl-D-galactosamine dehydrogenase